MVADAEVEGDKPAAGFLMVEVFTMIMTAKSEGVV